jgi:hypothetical protein
VSPWTIEKVLADPASTSGPAVAETGLRLDEDAIKPDPAQALWLYAQMVAAGQTIYSPVQAEAAAAVYAPALGPSISRPAATPVAQCLKLIDECVAQYMRSARNNSAHWCLAIR